MSGLGKILYEAAGHYYLDSARRQLNLHAERRGMNPERSARVNFKVTFPSLLNDKAFLSPDHRPQISIGPHNH